MHDMAGGMLSQELSFLDNKHSPAQFAWEYSFDKCTCLE